MTSPRFLLRLHGGFLIFLTVALTIGGFVGLATGAGPFSWITGAPIAAPGLVQAYLLMLLIGLVLWFGSYRAKDTTLFHWLGIGAHMVPLSLLPVFWSILGTVGATETAPASFIIHGGWIAVEASSLWRMRRAPSHG
ncbi:hypothetical protein [Actibacterium sp. 188UL27-1]|uniref:hypothetical protein n=1 Tax=Actibacterium sp. 188UL27-1 TaxID=2786961 RepID=UPI00195E68EF|nr:hypothetical protein [Actibacterium sp. 188UL27-1]MBM7067566.1 hypothetical protein [Actibacterium sp. 188UL27-1]